MNIKGNFGRGGNIKLWSRLIGLGIRSSIALFNCQNDQTANRVFMEGVAVCTLKEAYLIGN